MSASTAFVLMFFEVLKIFIDPENESYCALSLGKLS